MASRSDISGARMDNMLIMEKNRQGSTVLSSTGAAVAIDADMPPLLIAKLTAAAVFRLPAPTASIRGLRFTILNASTAAAAVTLASSTGATFTGPNDTIAQYNAADVVCDGADWSTIGATTA